MRWFILPLLVGGLTLPLINQTEAYAYLSRLYVLVSVGGYFLLAHGIARSARWLSLLLRLSRYTFFIYCTHTILIISQVRGLVARLMPLESVQGYFAVASLTILTCIALYHLLAWLCPRLLSLSLGGRL